MRVYVEAQTKAITKVICQVPGCPFVRLFRRIGLSCEDDPSLFNPALLVNHCI